VMGYRSNVPGGPDEPWDVPTDEELLASLDAYGHLTYVTGFSDEWNEDVSEDSDRGDWLACFDFKAWKHPSRGVLVAFHVVVNSDSGGCARTRTTARSDGKLTCEKQSSTQREVNDG
jgi:hypothetical protein